MLRNLISYVILPCQQSDPQSKTRNLAALVVSLSTVLRWSQDTSCSHASHLLSTHTQNMNVPVNQSGSRCAMISMHSSLVPRPHPKSYGAWERGYMHSTVQTTNCSTAMLQTLSLRILPHELRLAFSQLPRAQTYWSQDCSAAGYTLASDPGRGSTVVAPQVLVESSVMNILAGAQKIGTKGEILFGNETSPQDLFGRDCCMTGS